jgi:hypothetical protein
VPPWSSARAVPPAGRCQPLGGCGWHGRWAHLVPLDPALQRPPCLSERVREEAAQAHRAWPIRAGAIGGGDASAGKPRAAPQGKVLGGYSKRPSSYGGAIIARGCSVGGEL